MKHPPRNIDQSCFDWQKIILKKTDLPYQSKYLALYLASYMNMNRDFAYPGLRTIERETGMSHATVLKYLDLLVSEGWIGKQSGTRETSNRYWIAFPEGVGQEATYVSSGEKVGRELTQNNNKNNNTTTTRKRKPFVEPTLEEVKAYCAEKSLLFDPDYFFEHYTVAEWRDAGDKPIKNWKLTATSWNNREKKNGTNRQASAKHSSGVTTRRASDYLD